jgi:hypothetical protein
MIYDHESNDVEKFSFVPERLYVSPYDLESPVSCQIVSPESRRLRIYGNHSFSWPVPFRVVVQGRQGRLLLLTFTTLTNDIGLLRITS